MHAARMRLYGSFDLPPRANPCKGGCGKTLVRTGSRGYAPKWCPDCRRENFNRVRRDARADRIAAKMAEPLTCGRCEATMYRKHVSVTPTLCDPCAKARDYETVRRWIAEHPDEYRAMARRHTHERRTRKLSGNYEKFDDREIFERDGWICQIGKHPVDRSVEWPHPLYPTLDHIVPLSKGGEHARANTRLACWAHNAERGNRGGNEQLALIG